MTAGFRPPCFAQASLPEPIQYPPPPMEGLIHWYDARRSVWSDNGVTPAVNGNPVYRWDSQVGTGWNATQTTLAKRPLYVQNWLNGQPALSFNGAIQYLSGSKNLIGHGGTRLVVTQPISQDTGQFFWGAQNLGGTGSTLSLVAADAQGYADRKLGWYESTTGWARMLVRTTSPQSIQWDFKTNLTCDIWRNGVLGGNKVYVDGELKGLFAIGNRHTGDTYPFRGYIAQLLRWDHVLDASERASLNAWVTKLYGVLA